VVIDEAKATSPSEKASAAAPTAAAEIDYHNTVRLG